MTYQAEPSYRRAHSPSLARPTRRPGCGSSGTRTRTLQPNLVVTAVIAAIRVWVVSHVHRRAAATGARPVRRGCPVPRGLPLRVRWPAGPRRGRDTDVWSSGPTTRGSQGRPSARSRAGLRRLLHAQALPQLAIKAAQPMRRSTPRGSSYPWPGRDQRPAVSCGSSVAVTRAPSVRPRT